MTALALLLCTSMAAGCGKKPALTIREFVESSKPKEPPEAGRKQEEAEKGVGEEAAKKAKVN